MWLRNRIVFVGFGVGVHAVEAALAVGCLLLLLAEAAVVVAAVVAAAAELGRRSSHIVTLCLCLFGFAF